MKIKENEASPLIQSCAQISHHWTESKRQDPLARISRKIFSFKWNMFLSENNNITTTDQYKN